MNKLKIPQNHSGVSKTLRLPEDLVDNIQILANIKNLSFISSIIKLSFFIIIAKFKINHTTKNKLAFFANLFFVSFLISIILAIKKQRFYIKSVCDGAAEGI